MLKLKVQIEPHMDGCTSFRNNAMGMMIGLVVGDVLGCDCLGGFTGYVSPYIQRTRNKVFLHSTQPTYPTMMTIANLRSMTTIGFYSKSDITLSYIRCVGGLPIKPKENDALRIPFLLGRNTRVLLGNVKSTNNAIAMTTYHKRYVKFANDKCQSGAALSRCASYALFTDGPRKAMDDATITNPSLVVVHANYVYVLMLSKLIRRQVVTKVCLLSITHVHIDIVNTIQFACADDVYGFKSHFKIDFTGEMKSWVLIPLFMAIRALFYFDDIMTAFRALLMDIEWGGMRSNATINCAVVGAVLGAKFGMEEILKDPKMVYNWDRVRNWHQMDRQAFSVEQQTNDKLYTDTPCHMDFTLEGIETLIDNMNKGKSK